METKEELLSLRETQKLAGVGRAVIEKLMKAGDFPKVVKLSPGKHRWIKSEIEAWLQRKIQERNGA